MKKQIKAYTYEDLKDDILKLKSDFPETEVGTIGKSVWGKDLYYIKLGSGNLKVMYNGAHHGMEWITSAMLMKFAFDFLRSSKESKAFGGFNAKALARRATLYIVPMLNPDGVRLSALGLPNRLPIREKQRLLRMNGSEDFTKWQANANGIDLNHNYDALWQKSKEMEAEYGIYSPGPTRFSGPRAESEPESHALAEFTRKHDFALTIAFHSQGKVIYHGFMDKNPPRSYNIARAFTKISPYQLDSAEGIASFGGYKDWFVDKFNKPGYTVEVGLGQNPLPISNLPQIYSETLPILLGALTV
ncbi:MAG: M14 family metallocarboxypeptidase [Clostridia bacterium]|nr:M14 family metallocarboxypeptidase [Clostridia bacterium]